MTCAGVRARNAARAQHPRLAHHGDQQFDVAQHAVARIARPALLVQVRLQFHQLHQRLAVPGKHAVAQ